MFFPEINISKTKANAKRKLREYPRWRRIANDVGEQKVTQVFTFEPKGGHSKPSQPVEQLAIRKVDAESELLAIRQSITGLFEPMHRRILFDKYLAAYPKKDYQIYTELGYERTQYYEMLDNALLAFAELYRSGVLLVTKPD
ncbi:ArpU family transcriptional regulator [Streptococcus chenjunshii]|uniref:ArpU family transcriptional regulator n=1 Tax=Streptococcus chenjunshii TaxID=2173853 RepID=A0A372KML0_9STRE|nr:ArpU family transcriptional regulator [Streptococcus chenjunshii]RFU53206.1 ArpU family transcriptional regulator [Streptococcus chenjunshii]